MKQYILAFGLALAGEARAEEQKECIDKIAIDFQIAEVGDIFSTTALEGTGPEYETLRKNIEVSVKILFEQQLGIPVSIQYFGPLHENLEGNIAVTYTTRREWLSSLRKDKNKLDGFLKYNTLPDSYKQGLAKEGIKGIDLATIAAHDEDIALKPNTITLFWFPIEIDNYWTSEHLRTLAGIKPTQEETTRRYASHLGLLLSHQIGHLFGLQHPDTQNKYIEMGANKYYNNMSVPVLFNIHQTFSPEDKAKIRSQLCKPEEIK